MTCALVFGASGQIGRFLVPRLLTQGHQVLAVSRHAREAVRPRLRWIVGDLFCTMPDVPKVETIYRLGPQTGFSAWLERAERPHQSRVVAIGSMSVFSKRESGDAAERARSESLRQSEQQLASASEHRRLAWTVLRPTLIYGAGMDRSLTPLARFGMRYRLFPRFPGASGLRQPVHAADLAEACLAVAGNRVAHDRTYDLGGGERLAFSSMLERVRQSLPCLALGVPLPRALLVAARSVASVVPRWRSPHRGAVDRLRADLVADDSEARSEWGWSPRPFRPDAATWAVQPLD
jgi:nucleoside-diphosphate-sugar epimerase